MQQNRQLPGHGHDGTLLAATSTTLGQLQSPAPEIAVHGGIRANLAVGDKSR